MPELYTYRYPNAASYALLPINAAHGAFVGQGRMLRHGYIFGYKRTTAAADLAAAGTAASIPVGGAVTSAVAAYRQIDYQNSKIFQFNPPALSMSVQMMAVEDPELGSGEGNLPTPAVGLASSNLELFFDRTEEIARANAGAGDEKWRELGVQMDLYELLKVISGGAESLLGEYTDPGSDPDAGVAGGSVQAGSLNHFTGALFDAAVGGSKLVYEPFAVVFNPNLAVHVMKMTSFAFTYLRFTSDLVPTSLKVEMGLEITNMGTKSYAISGGTGGPLGSTAAPAAGTTAPPGTTATPPTIPAVGAF
jgi:hypothetical protein